MADLATALSNCLIKDGTLAASNQTLTVTGSGDVLHLLNTSSASTVYVRGNNAASSNSLMLQQNTTPNCRVKALGTGGNLILGAGAVNGGDLVTLTSSTGQLTAYEPQFTTAAVKNVSTDDSGSFTASMTGCTTVPTFTVFWRRTGQLVSLVVDTGGTATSNTTALSLTGIPANLRPVKQIYQVVGAINNGVEELALVYITASGSVINYGRVGGAGYTNSGNKGIDAFCITYPLV